MAVAVNIIVKDTTVSPQPISGVTVNIYNSTTFAFLASATSDGAGQAAFVLPGAVSPGTVYEVRLYKAGVLFSNPHLIAVIDPVVAPVTNDFDISGMLLTLPIATDPRMCRCTGQFINFSGTPIQNTLVRVIAVLGVGTLTKQPEICIPPFLTVPPPLPPTLLSGFQVPKVVDGKMVSVGEMEVRTDINGKVSLDLIRGGMYYVTFAGEEDVVWPIVVPDRSSVNLIDLIHPAPVSLTWDSSDAPGDAISLTVGETKTVAFTVLFTNFHTYASNLGNIIAFTNSDGTVADLFYNSSLGRVELAGRVAGTLNVTVAVQPNMTPARLPDYTISAAPLVVTVS